MKLTKRKKLQRRKFYLSGQKRFEHELNKLRGYAK